MTIEKIVKVQSLVRKLLHVENIALQILYVHFEIA